MDNNRQSRTIVVIDDDEIDQKMYGRIIKRSGRFDQIVSFYLAEDALSYFQDPANRRVDLVLLDIHMPRMNGFEFLEEATLRFGDEFTQLVVFMLTTSLNESDKKRAGQFNVVKQYVSKPLTSEKLDSMIALIPD